MHLLGQHRAQIVVEIANSLGHSTTNVMCVVGLMLCRSVRRAPALPPSRSVWGWASWVP